MRIRIRRLALLAAVLATGTALSQRVEAQGGQRKGEGALVIRDGAPGYEEKSGTTQKRTFKRGEGVAGFHKEFLATTYEFFEEGGRVRVLYPKPDSALMADAWMDPADLATFVYDCCDDECIPVKASFKRSEWNPCFKEGMSRARASLPPAGGEPAPAEKSGSGAGRGSRSSAGPGEKALTNDDVVAMVKADLGDDLVIAKVQQAPREALDVSSEALVRLKKQGVSKGVLDAMLRRAGQR